MAASFPELLAAVEYLGESVRPAGPVDQKKSSELLPFAEAAAKPATGAVCSHACKVLPPEEPFKRK